MQEKFSGEDGKPQGQILTSAAETSIMLLLKIGVIVRRLRPVRGRKAAHGKETT